MQLIKIIIILSLFNILSCNNSHLQSNVKYNKIQNRINKYKLWGDLIFEDSNPEISKAKKSNELVFLLKNFDLYDENKDYTRINYLLLRHWKDSVTKLTYILGDLEVLRYIFENRDIRFSGSKILKCEPIIYSISFLQLDFIKYFIEEKNVNYQNKNKHVLNYFYNTIILNKEDFYIGEDHIENGKYRNITKNIEDTLIKSFEIFDYFINKKFFKFEDLLKKCKKNCYDNNFSIIESLFEIGEVIFYQYLESKFKKINIDYIYKDGKTHLLKIIKSGNIKRKLFTFPIYGPRDSYDEYYNEHHVIGKEIKIIYEDYGSYDRRKEFIKYLILDGINLNILDNTYKTALDYLYEIIDKFNYDNENGIYIVKKEKEIVKLLRKYGAKRGCELLNKKCEER